MTLSPSEGATALVDLAMLDIAGLEPYRGDVFAVVGGDRTQALTLAGVDALAPSTGPGRRQPFVLTFTGPREAMLAQRIHTLEHTTLGRVDIFLVPIEPDARGARYEAVFS